MLEQSVDSRGGGDEGADRSAYEILPIKGKRERAVRHALSSEGGTPGFRTLDDLSLVPKRVFDRFG
jgi:hypothetical protein